MNVTPYTDPSILDHFDTKNGSTVNNHFHLITVQPQLSLTQTQCQQLFSYCMERFKVDNNVYRCSACIEENKTRDGYHLHIFVNSINQRPDAFRRSYKHYIETYIKEVYKQSKHLIRALVITTCNKRLNSPEKQYAYVHKEGINIFDNIDTTTFTQRDTSTNPIDITIQELDYAEDNLVLASHPRYAAEVYRRVAPELKSHYQAMSIAKFIRDIYRQ